MVLDGFKIYLENPKYCYFPGDEVKGTVVLRTSEEITVKGIQITLLGRLFVEWTDRTSSNANHGHAQGTGFTHGKWLGSSHGMARTYSHRESLFEFKQMLISDGDEEVTLEAGTTAHPFSFQLPANNLPSSFVGQHGKVEYLVVAALQRSCSSCDFPTQQFITVNSIVDLNQDPVAWQAGNWRDAKTFSCVCCTNEPLIVKIHTEARGYCPGEVMMVEVEANNRSTMEVTAFSVALLQESIFYAQNNKKVVEKPMHYEKKALVVHPGKSGIELTKIHIPRVPPTSSETTGTIDLHYTLLVTVQLSGSLAGLSLRCPIIIGTVPIRKGGDSADVVVVRKRMIRSAPPILSRRKFSAGTEPEDGADINENFQKSELEQTTDNQDEKTVGQHFWTKVRDRLNSYHHLYTQITS